jgi:predicted transcriptional regulator
MKVKRIVIRPRNEVDSELRAFGKALDRGESPKSLKGEYFESLEAVRTFLTERRLELWRTIRDQTPRSLTELAKRVGRDYKDVHQDVSILVEVGLVELQKPKNATTRALQPVSLVEALEFRVA